VRELAGARAHSAAIVSPDESSEHSNAVEMDCRLPLKFDIQVAVQGASATGGHRLAMRLGMPDGSSRLLRLHVVDVITPDQEESAAPASWGGDVAADTCSSPSKAGGEDVTAAESTAPTVDAGDGWTMVRGWVTIEVLRPWSRPGFVTLAPVATLPPAEANALKLLGGDGSLSLGRSRRFLLHPLKRA